MNRKYTKNLIIKLFLLEEKKINLKFEVILQE